MEKFLYLFLPMAVVFKLFITKKETNFELFIKYLGLCFINNLISSILIYLYFPNVKLFNETIIFFIRYSITSLGVGFIMAIIYRLFKNFWHIKFEVKYENKN